MTESAKTLVEQVDALLPQIHCRRCGFEGCRPYAEALVSGKTTVDRCPPGGTETLQALSDLLKLVPNALFPFEPIPPEVVATVHEELCIGCTKCIQVCPVDAIVGASKHIHQVVASLCTGCGLCPDACPVEGCIDLVARSSSPAETQARSELSRRAYTKRRQRLQLQAQAPSRRDRLEKMRLDIREAVARVQAKKKNL